MIELLFKALTDLKNPKILWRLFLPFALSIALVSLLGYSFFAFLLSSDWLMSNSVVAGVDQGADQAGQWLAGIPLIGGAIVWTLTLIVTLFIGLISLVVGSYLVLLFAMLITAFMTESLVKVIHETHYAELEYQGHGHFLAMVFKLLGFGLLMLLVLILSLPILFIPLLNVVWIWLIGFLFFRYALILDVGQTILNAEDYKARKSIFNWTPTLNLALIYSLALLPLMGLFVPVIGVIMLAHWLFSGQKELSENKLLKNPLV